MTASPRRPSASTGPALLGGQRRHVGRSQEGGAHQGGGGDEHDGSDRRPAATAERTSPPRAGRACRPTPTGPGVGLISTAASGGRPGGRDPGSGPAGARAGAGTPPRPTAGCRARRRGSAAAFDMRTGRRPVGRSGRGRASASRPGARAAGTGRRGRRGHRARRGDREPSPPRPTARWRPLCDSSNRAATGATTPFIDVRSPSTSPRHSPSASFRSAAAAAGSSASDARPAATSSSKRTASMSTPAASRR